MDKQVPTNVADSGKIRLGGTAPSLPPVRSTPASIADTGKVRTGGTAKSL